MLDGRGRNCHFSLSSSIFVSFFASFIVVRAQLAPAVFMNRTSTIHAYFSLFLSPLYLRYTSLHVLCNRNEPLSKLELQGMLRWWKACTNVMAEAGEQRIAAGEELDVL